MNGDAVIRLILLNLISRPFDQRRGRSEQEYQLGEEVLQRTGLRYVTMLSIKDSRSAPPRQNKKAQKN